MKFHDHILSDVSVTSEVCMAVILILLIVGNRRVQRWRGL